MICSLTVLFFEQILVNIVSCDHMTKYHDRCVLIHTQEVAFLLIYMLDLCISSQYYHLLQNFCPYHCSEQQLLDALRRLSQRVTYCVRISLHDNRSGFEIPITRSFSLRMRHIRFQNSTLSSLSHRVAVIDWGTIFETSLHLRQVATLRG
jgi:hypothetical protein